MREFESPHRLDASGESDACGGVAILVAKALCAHRPSETDIVRGRVLHLTCWSHAVRLDLFAIYNFASASAITRCSA